MWKYFNVITLVTSLFTSLLSSLYKTKAASMQAGDLVATAADEGGSIPVIFGTCDVSPNVTAFLAGTPRAIKK